LPPPRILPRGGARAPPTGATIPARDNLFWARGRSPPPPPAPQLITGRIPGPPRSPKKTPRGKLGSPGQYWQTHPQQPPWGANDFPFFNATPAPKRGARDSSPGVPPPGVGPAVKFGFFKKKKNPDLPPARERNVAPPKGHSPPPRGVWAFFFCLAPSWWGGGLKTPKKQPGAKTFFPPFTPPGFLPPPPLFGAFLFFFSPWGAQSHSLKFLNLP